MRLTLLQQRLLAFGSLLLLAAGVFALPYCFPVPPTLSISYAVGFNNRVAVACFVLFGLLFTWFVQDLLPAPHPTDRRLPGWTFWAATGVTALCCAGWILQRTHRHFNLGSEFDYSAERQYHLDAGQRLYRDFEYAYGPLLISIGHWFHQLFHLTGPQAYRLGWAVEWVLGAAMLWFLIARIQLPTRYRLLLLLFLFAAQMSSITNGGVNYAPLRTFCAAFCAVLVHLTWTRSHLPYRTATVIAGCIVFGFAVSPEQGSALLLGLTAYALLLAWRNRTAFPVPAVLLVLAADLLIFALASASGLLDTARVFAQGGLSIPLLPSPVNLFILAIHLCGLGLFLRALRTGQLESVALPLGLCGIPMLLSAMGRCDIGHLTSAAPLYLAGWFALSQRPRIFALFLILGCYFFLDAGHLYRFALHRPQPVAVSRLAVPTAPASSQPTGHQPIPDQPIPDGRAYSVPFFVPVDGAGYVRWHAFVGFYYGIGNITTAPAIEAKRQDVIARRSPYLILPDGPGGMSLHSREENIALAGPIEGLPWSPRQRHPMPSFDSLAETIRQMYEPTGEAQDGWRVWKLRTTP